MSIVPTTTGPGAPVYPGTGPAPMPKASSGPQPNPYRNPVQGPNGTLPIKGGVS